MIGDARQYRGDLKKGAITYAKGRRPLLGGSRPPVAIDGERRLVRPTVPGLPIDGETSYDANGNAATRNGQSITWTSYNYPTVINDIGKSLTFSYEGVAYVSCRN